MLHYAVAFFRRRASLLLLSLAGCVEPYAPDVVNSSTNYLVVDGFINGNGRTRIKLARAIAVGATSAPPTEPGALLAVVDDAGTRYALTETSSGTYRSDSVLLDPARRYQLRITTAGHVDYQSDPVPLKVTPPIDQLKRQVTGDNVLFNLSTHDPQGKSRYYRWNFTETWEFNSAYTSQLEYYPATKTIGPRTTPIYTCWRTERSTSIKQASTAQLSQDALTDADLFSVARRAERFKIRYSVLVSQYAETAAEFAYYELLRKNTEAVGSVNDPLPTQLTGNVHRTDGTAEPVLGFVSAHTVQQRRLFIDRQDLPVLNDYDFDSPYTSCRLGRELLRGRPDSVYVIRYPNTIVFSDPSQRVPIALIIYPSANDPTRTPIIQGYLGSTAFCVDCRTRGTSTKPSFW